VTRRLHGHTPFERVFWWDMLLVGTTINLAAGALAVAAHLHGAPLWLAAVIFLSPLPWNALLTTAVWRAVEGRPDPQRSLVRVTAIVWLVLMVLV
jgi:L-asparagine transporter-like permease